jgi:hypothetical protein
MTTTLTFKQYQLISAYLDGRCSSREKITVESMLEKDAELKRVLAEFARSKKMLAALPSARAPRNFTISPAMAPQKPQRFFLAPALNYASLVAAVLFVFIFAGSRLLPSLNTSSAAENAAPMMAAVATDSASNDTISRIIIWGHVGGMGGGDGSTGAAPLGIGGGDTGAPPSTISKNPIVETNPLTTSTPESFSTDTVVDPSNLILGLPDASIQGKEISPETATAPLRTIAPVSWTLISEIGLASLAVLLALIAWFLRRRH